MPNPSSLSKSQMLQLALKRGLINQEQYQTGISKLENNSEDEKSLSKRNMLDLALQRGIISPEQFQVGLSKLEGGNTPSEEQVEEQPQDEYSKRREKSLKKLEGLPKFAKDIYGEYLYPSREKMDREKQGIAKSARNIATLPGAVLDLPMLPVNIGLMASGKDSYVPSQMIGNAIDTATGGYTRPGTNMEKVNEAVMQSVLPMGAIVKGAGYVANLGAKHGSKALNKVGNFFQKSNAINPTNVAATAGGSAATQEFVNQNPDGGVLGSVGAGFLGSLAAGKAMNNKHLFTHPGAWAAQKLGVNHQKVENQIPNGRGGFIPTTLGDISNSETIQMIQNSLEKTPFLSKVLRGARNQGLEAEQKSLNELGLKSALGAEETGDLALKGIGNYENSIAARDVKNYGKVQEGLKTHAKPYSPSNSKPYERHKPKEAPQQKGKIIKDSKTGDEFILTPEGDIVPAKASTNATKQPLSKKQSEREMIEHYTGKSVDEMAKEAINLVPHPHTEKFIGKNFSKLESPEAQHNLFNEKFGQVTKDLHNIASDYDGKGIPYNSLQQIRKSIDDAVSTWGQTGKVTQEKLKNFRRAIHKDTASYLESVDPALKVQWDEANALKSSYLKKDLPTINEIKGIADKRTLEDVTKSLVSNLKNAGRKVEIVSKGLNDKQKKTLGVSLINQLGQNADEEFNLFAMAKNARKMKGNGKAAFLNLLPEESREPFQRLVRRMGNVQETLNQGNKSGTAYYNKIWAILKNPIKSVGGYAVSVPLVNLYTSPKFINWVSKGAILSNDKQLLNHVQKLKTLNLGSNALNQGVRSLYDRIQEKE